MVLWVGVAHLRVLLADLIVAATLPDGDPLEDIHRLWPTVHFTESAARQPSASEVSIRKRRRL